MQLFNKIQFTTSWFSERSKNIAFDFQTRSTSALYARIMREKKLNFPKGRGLNVFISPQARDGYCSAEPATFYYLESTQDIRQFLLLDSLEKKKFTLDLIEHSMTSVGKVLNFDVSPFKDASEVVRKLCYKNEWQWKSGTKLSPSKKMRCMVFVRHEVDRFDILVRVEGRGGNSIFNELVFSDDHPDEIIINNRLGAVEWVGDESILIKSKIDGVSPIFVDLLQKFSS